MKKALQLLVLLVLLFQSISYSQCGFNLIAIGTNDYFGNASAIEAIGNTYYIATTQGLFITSDDGATHTRKTMADGLPSNDIRDMAVENGILYLATLDAGLAISTDGGNTFSVKTTADGLYDNQINRIDVDNGKIYVFYEFGNRLSDAAVSVSTDGGNTFTARILENRGVDNQGVFDNAFAVDRGRIFIGLGDGIMVSTDDGVSYELVPGYPSFQDRNGSARRIAADGPTIVAGSNNGELYVSRDYGQTFTTKTVGQGSIFKIFVKGNTIMLGRYDTDLRAGVLSISQDGGNSFTEYNEDDDNIGGIPYGVFADDNHLLIGCSRGYSIGNNDCLIPIVPPTPCVVSNVVQSGASMCNGEDASFTLTFDVSGGSGNYNLVIAETDSTLGVIEGQVIGNLGGAATTTTGLTIEGTLPSSIAGGSIKVLVKDRLLPLCTDGNIITVNTASCATVCGINSLSINEDPICDGINGTMTVYFNVANGSGDYDLIAAEDNTDIGVVKDQVLGSINGGATDSYFVPITGLIPTDDAASTLKVTVIDRNDPACIPADSLVLKLPDCLVNLPNVPFGDVCEPINEIPLVDRYFSLSQPANPTLIRTGQSFRAPAGIGTINGVILYVRGMTSGEVNLDFYKGWPSSSEPFIGTKIASATLNNDLDFQVLTPFADRAAYFEFETPVNLSTDTIYHFLLDNYPGGTGKTTFVTGGNPIFGNQLSQSQNNDRLGLSFSDLKFSLYTCASIPQDCSINTIFATQEDACNDGNAQITVSFNVVNGSGNYDLITTEANAGLGLVAGQVLGSINNGKADSSFYQIKGVFPATTSPASIKVSIQDRDNIGCAIADTITVQVANCVADSIILGSQQEVNDFIAAYGNRTILMGSLIIEGSDINDLSGLANISSIESDLIIRNNTALADLMGLENLTNIGGSLEIENNTALTALSGLDNLTTIGGNLVIKDNPLLMDLNGIPSISIVGTVTTLFTRLNLRSGGPGPVNGNIEIINNASLTNIDGLANIVRITGCIIILDNPLLMNIDGLQNLVQINGDIEINNNRSLDEFCGLQPLLTASSNGVASVDISGNNSNPDISDIQSGQACIRGLPESEVTAAELPSIPKNHLLVLSLLMIFGACVSFKLLS